MTTSFINAVHQHDTVTVRLSLSDELLMNPHGTDISAMLQMAEKEIPELYQADNGKLYSSDESSWDKEFLYDLKNDLDTNFSREKFSMYKKVIRQISGAGTPETSVKEQDILMTTQQGSMGNTSASNKDNSELLYPSLMIGGAVIGITGLCFSKIALTTIGAASFALGTFICYKKSKR